MLAWRRPSLHQQGNVHIQHHHFSLDTSGLPREAALSAVVPCSVAQFFLASHARPVISFLKAALPRPPSFAIPFCMSANRSMQHVRPRHSCRKDSCLLLALPRRLLCIQDITSIVLPHLTVYRRNSALEACQVRSRTMRSAFAEYLAWSSFQSH